MSCLSAGKWEDNRIKSTKDQRNPGDWSLFSAPIHIRFHHHYLGYQLPAVTEIGAEPKYSYFVTHALGEFFFLPLLSCTTCVCQAINPRSFFLLLFLARTLGLKVNQVFLIWYVLISPCLKRSDFIDLIC